MPVTPFSHLGKFIHKFKIPIILLWVLAAGSCIPFIPDVMSPFKSTGFVDLNSPSAKADQYLDDKLGFYQNRFLILYKSDQLLASDLAFKQKIKKSLAELNNFPLDHEIIYPNDNKKLISKDKHTAYVVILFKDKNPMTQDLLEQFKASIKPPTDMEMMLGGKSIFLEGVQQQTKADLYKADLIAAPISIVILLLIFGSVIAALLPLILGGISALAILTTLYFIGHAFTLSIFTINIALLLGLCLSLDYSLFIISRFREELYATNDIEIAISTTLATAGKAIFFSGLAVFVSLSALLLFPVNILFSVGVGGLVAVFFAVTIALLLLPAILSLLNSRIDLLPIRFLKRNKAPTFHFWGWIARNVVNRPLFFFFSILMVLLLLGYPFLKANFGISDENILPPHSESRQFFDNYKANFDEHELTPITMVVTTKDNILSKKNISKLYDLTTQLSKNPLINQVNSIVTTKPRLKKNQYHALYKSDTNQSAAVKTLLTTTTREHLSTISMISRANINSPEMRSLVEELKNLKPPPGFTLQLTGVPVNNLEVLDSIANVFPYAVIWIMVLTYLILMLLLRSLFLPFKAIMMNLLSLCASYGVLIFIFQEGNLHNILNFSPQGMVDVSLLIIIFCALFGFSMDYEVFLLTRIKEGYLKYKDNDKSIIFGIEQSSRIITSTAIIVIFICGSFMVADVLMVKEFGLGIAIAIFVDAFLIRSLLVPSTMALVNKWNWYLPKWLDNILP